MALTLGEVDVYVRAAARAEQRRRINLVVDVSHALHDAQRHVEDLRSTMRGVDDGD